MVLCDLPYGTTGSKWDAVIPADVIWKPVPLLEYLINTYTEPGQIVLDNCMGAGSTGVACVNTGRNFIGMELDQEYYDTACRRIEAAKERIIEHGS
mgnify:CR=1 FL=1